MHRAIPQLTAAVLFALASSGGAFAFGAIAVDDDSGQDPSDAGYALVAEAPSRQAAANQAMAECRVKENTDCRVVLTFAKCGAYAASVFNYGAGAGNTVKQAEAAALRSCGGPDCQIVVSDCQD